MTAENFISTNHQKPEPGQICYFISPINKVETGFWWGTIGFTSIDLMYKGYYAKFWKPCDAPMHEEDLPKMYFDLMPGEVKKKKPGKHK